MVHSLTSISQVYTGPDIILRWHNCMIDGKSGVMEASHAKKWHDLGPRLLCIGFGMIGVQNGMIHAYDLR